MERISVFNYESFYLDFLEGNLNEEDTALFLDFIATHPELEVDLDELPTVDVALIKVDADFVNGLKQTDFETDSITFKSAESFMIASIEGQLSNQKEKELLEFVSNHKTMVIEFEQIKKLKLVADQRIVFGDKGILKQSKKFVLWPYVAVAASILFAIFIYQGFQTNESNSIGLALKNSKGNEKPKSNSSNNPQNNSGKELNEQQNFDNVVVKNDQVKVNALANEHPSNKATLAKNETKENSRQVDVKKTKNDLEIAAIDKKDILITKAVAPQLIEVEVKNQTIAEAKSNDSKSNQSGVLAMNEMKNPIKPITNRLSDLTNTEIDVRTAQKAQGKRKGFYVKVGKFEIERK